MLCKSEQQAEPLEILYRDDYLVAINKPNGLLVHRSRIAKYANQFAVQVLREQIGQPVYLLHRLDRPTSGVLLFALQSETAKLACEQFATRTVDKNYKAIVRGEIGTGCWNEPLKEKLDRTTDGKAIQNKSPQSATTWFKQLESFEIPISAGKYTSSRYSLVEVTPTTGRKHQIRRHFNHLSHPIIGDTTYGDRRHNRLFRERLGVDRLLLAATRLRMVHPITGSDLEVNAPLGSDFEAALKRLRE